MNRPLVEIFRYNKWANLQLLEACRGLTDEQLDSHPSGISGSIRGLLMHVVGGQETSALRTKGRQNPVELTRSSEWPGFDVLIERANASSDELIAIAEGMDTDTDVDLPYGDKVYRYPKSFFLAGAIQHGLEHRTEVKVGLNQLGVETPDLDGWPYAEAAGYGLEVG
jgi:uncharacterized damage-inducible protein DinB